MTRDGVVHENLKAALLVKMKSGESKADLLASMKSCESDEPDIPHGLVHVHAYAARQSSRRGAKALKPALLWRGARHDHGVPRPREAAPMPPDHGMDHPACGGVLPRVARWVGNGRGMVLEDGTEAGRSRGRDEPTDGHPHPSGITRAGVWRSRAAATHGGAWRTRPPRAAWAWPVSPVQRSWGGPRGASRAGVARLTPRGGSTRGGRAALAEASARGPRGDERVRWGARAWSSTRGAGAGRGAESTSPPRWATPPAGEVTP